MARPVVYVTLAQFCESNDAPLAVLETAGFEVRLNTLGRRVRLEEMPQLLQDVDAVLAGVEAYPATLLEALPRLRCISRCGVGTDAIDLDAAARLRISVLTTPGVVAQPVAEMTVAMMLSLARNFPRHQADFRAGIWQKHTGHLLSEWTIGLVGFGQIGRAVERLLRPFGPHILVSDPYIDRSELPDSVEPCDLQALLAASDLVSIHAARPVAAGPLLGWSELRTMKPGSRLVNTARGYLVDEEALREALTDGHLAGVALDVFAEEPYRGPLSALPQVLCTPHVATLTYASRAAMELQSAQNVVTHFAGVLGGAMARNGL